MDDQVTRMLTVAKGRMVLSHPFFAALMLRLKIIESDQIKTAATDGEHLYYNPTFLGSLQPKEVIGVLAHEVMHNAMGHCWRRGRRNPSKWNAAADYAINQIIIDAGLKLPEGAFLDPQYNNKSAEEIYNLLPEDENKKPDKGSGGGQGAGQEQEPNMDPGRCGACMDHPEPDKRAELEAEWKVAVVQAARIAQGNLPAQLKRLVQSIVEPEIPWQTLLRDFVERTARNDYNWTRPNRRFLQNNIVLPSLISEELPMLAIVIDSSGSINDKMLSRFSAGASEVLGAYDTTILVIFSDAKVQSVHEYTRADLPLELKPMGGGGTDFRPAFNYISKEGITPCCLVYFTDMYGSFPSSEPEFPVMWLSTSKNVAAPFGTVVKFNDN